MVRLWSGVGKLCEMEYDKSVGRSRATVSDGVRLVRSAKKENCVGWSTVRLWGGVGHLCKMEYDKSVGRSRGTVWGRVW